jgi:hypothetical protein
MGPWPGSNGYMQDLIYKHPMPLASKNLWLSTLALFTKCLIQYLSIKFKNDTTH